VVSVTPDRYMMPRPDPHAGHRLVALTGRLHPERTMVGALACFDCAAILRPLRVCGLPTKKGTACRTPIREDLGFETCWSHGEGRGRTNTPRQVPAPSNGAGP
jgi:hypothetical protein